MTRIGVVCGAFLVLVVLGFVFLARTFGANSAQDEVRPFLASVEREGARKLCSNGDGGHGPDNREPWYEVYYEIADRSGLTDAIEADATRAGYPLEQDTDSIAYLKDATGLEPHFNPDADYLVSERNGNRLTVTVDRNTSVPLYCGVGHYGDRRPTGPDHAIVTIEMELPRR